VTIAGFFAWVRGGHRQFGATQWILRVIAALPLVLSSVGHFLRTDVFASIVPPIFPHPAFWVVLTGMMELAGAIGLLVPKTTRAASTCIALLMVAVFPANIYAANTVVGGLPMPGVAVRLAMQVVFILLVLIAGWGVPRRSVE